MLHDEPIDLIADAATHALCHVNNHQHRTCSDALLDPVQRRALGSHARWTELPTLA
jgi:hypothetical protein